MPSGKPKVAWMPTSRSHRHHNIERKPHGNCTTVAWECLPVKSLRLPLQRSVRFIRFDVKLADVYIPTRGFMKLVSAQGAMSEADTTALLARSLAGAQ